MKWSPQPAGRSWSRHAIAASPKSPSARRVSAVCRTRSSRTTARRSACCATCEGAISTGVIAEYPERGIVEIARPVGVVAAIVPSTNPGATPANNVINALKCGNAIILSPSPKGYSTCAKLLEYIDEELRRVGAPRDLVQLLPQPITKELSRELMRQADLVVVTGSQSNVRAGYSSGTPRSASARATWR